MTTSGTEKSGIPAPENETFVGRWSRRKRAEPVVRVHEDTGIAAQAAQAQAQQARDDANVLAQQNADAEQKLPADLPPVESLTKDSDYTRFMQPDVPRASRNAAMKKLFTDPHFNVMDGLDTYIDDYTKEDPIPEAMLRELAQSKMLGLFDEKKEDEASAAVVDAIAESDVAASADAEIRAAKQTLDPTPAPTLDSASERSFERTVERTAEPVPPPTVQPYNPPAPKPPKPIV